MISQMGFTKNQSKSALNNIEHLDAELAVQWILQNPEVGLSPDKTEIKKKELGAIEEESVEIKNEFANSKQLNAEEF